MLSAKEVVERREKPPPELPAFGIKDFEPDGSLEESYQIQQSISAIKNILSYTKVKSLNSLSQAVWQPGLRLAEITQQNGSYWAYMGHKRGDKLYIYPEEALYLLENGSIQIIYNGVSLSVQRAYFVLLGAENNIPLEKYRVYSLLNSYGYKVLRHSSKNSVTNYEKKLEVHKLGLKLKKDVEAVTKGKRQLDSNDGCLENSKKLKAETSTHAFSCEKKFNIDNLKKIQESQCSHNNEMSLDFDYDIYSESSDTSTFKKSCLQLPNFRVIIHRGEDSPADLKEICKLSSKYKDEIPIIHAIVFPDNVAFYKINPVILPDIND